GTAQLPRCRGAPGLTDGPDRLVGDEHGPELLVGQTRERSLGLLEDVGGAPPGVPDLGGFPDAEESQCPVPERGCDFQPRRLDGLPEVLPTLRVADLDDACAGVERLGYGDLARPGPRVIPVRVLGAEDDAGIVHRDLAYRGECGERWNDERLYAGEVAIPQLLDEPDGVVTRLRQRLVHLPAGAHPYRHRSHTLVGADRVDLGAGAGVRVEGEPEPLLDQGACEFESDDPLSHAEDLCVVRQHGALHGVDVV